jgi:hypothetical protein
MLDKNDPLDGYEKFNNIEKGNNNNIKISDYELLDTIGIGMYLN